MKYDVIVMGAGHNGLVAAAYLAKAGKSVLMLEAADEIGGATASVRAFKEYDALLSRYSYLVALLPDQIVQDLGLNFETISREVSSFTPYKKDGKDCGLHISRVWDKETEDSFIELTGSAHEGKAWQEFYSEVEKFAQKMAPTFLQPLRTRSEIKALIGQDSTWEYLVEKPMAEIIKSKFSDDLVRGVVLTDALIGTFASAQSIQSNICFLYHLMGNGTGEWKVPRGGMVALVNDLERVVRSAGVEIRTGAEITHVSTDSAGVTVQTKNAESFTAEFLLSNAAPAHLDRMRGKESEPTLSGSQIKINMLLTRLPRLKSGVDPRIAFAGTFHINESYSHLNLTYEIAAGGKMPDRLPLEMYCHTLTDPSILSPELARQGYHTLTLFGLHTDASLFDANPEQSRDAAVASALASLNEYLEDPIESVLARNSDGTYALEAKSPLDLEEAIGLPRGNIFHRDLDFPFIEDDEATDIPQWGCETDDPHIFIAGAGARRGGGVSGIAGHNAAASVLSRR
jgi:phytoene dehydrogenase-like protein